MYKRQVDIRGLLLSREERMGAEGRGKEGKRKERRVGKKRGKEGREEETKGRNKVKEGEL